MNRALDVFGLMIGDNQMIVDRQFMDCSLFRAVGKLLVLCC